MTRGSGHVDLEDAESIALAGLAFLAEDGARLGRFLALTGIGPEDLRSRADAPQTLAAVLEHILGDESLLLVFAAHKAIRADQVAPAHALLSGSLPRT
jgi:Protein of unknown function (DUF3572)